MTALTNDILEIDAFGSDGSVSLDVTANDGLEGDFIILSLNGASLGQSVAGVYGSIQLSVTGEATYTLDGFDKASAEDWVTEGEFLTEIFTYQLIDLATGQLRTGTIEVQVSPTFDSVILSSDASVNATGDSEIIIGESDTGQEIGAKDGDDLIFGGEGNDTLWGDGGDDTIFGGGGDDRIDLGNGDRNIDGGEGTDTGFGLGFDDVGTFDAEAMNLEFLEVSGSFLSGFAGDAEGTGEAVFNADWTYVSLTEEYAGGTYEYTFGADNEVSTVYYYSGPFFEYTEYDLDDVEDWSVYQEIGDFISYTERYTYDDGIVHDRNFIFGSLQNELWTDVEDVEIWQTISTTYNVGEIFPLFDGPVILIEEPGGLLEIPEEPLGTLLKTTVTVYDNLDQKTETFYSDGTKKTVEQDLSDTQDWTLYTGTVNEEAEMLISEEWEFDDGSLREVQYHANGLMKEEYTEETDGDTSQKTFAEDGTLVRTILKDISESENWFFHETNYDAAGQITDTAIDWDNGIYAESFYSNGILVSRELEDLGDVQPWATAFRLFSKSGLKKYETTFDGEGTQMTALRRDLADQFDWKQVEKDFDANGDLSSKVTTWDGGNVVAENYFGEIVTKRVTDDAADKSPWQTKTQTYGESGELLTLSFLWDGGNETVSTFEDGALVQKRVIDHEDKYDWYFKTQTFDAETGELTEENYLADELAF